MVYLQLLVGLGVGLLGVGLAYLMYKPQLYEAQEERSNSNWRNSSYSGNESPNKNKQRKARLGDKCPVCLLHMYDERDMRFLICDHAMHRSCYEECRKVRWLCPICDTKFAMLSEVGDECVICIEPMQIDNMEYMQCEHALHENCLRKYKEVGNRLCPLCRKNI